MKEVTIKCKQCYDTGNPCFTCNPDDNDICDVCNYPPYGERDKDGNFICNCKIKEK